MKVNYLFVLLMTVPILVGRTEEIKVKSGEKNFSIYFDSPLFYKYWHDVTKFSIVTVNFEYRLKMSHSNSTFLSVGYGKMFSTEGYNVSYNIFTTEIKKIFGKKTHFLETGVGVNFSTPHIIFRIGYRAELFDRILLCIEYTPYLLIDETKFYDPYRMELHNSLSLSLGYRFGIHISNETWNTKFNRLYGLQVNFQSIFKDYKGGKGYYGNLFLEISLYKTKKLLLTSGLGFGYGNSYSGKGRFSYNSFPIGFTMLYGKKKHFAEAGIRFTWMPIGGNNDGTFFTLQPEIGYRIHIGKRLFARLAYTPYWWLSNEEGKQYIERSFVNSATVGAGIRFH